MLRVLLIGLIGIVFLAGCSSTPSSKSTPQSVGTGMTERSASSQGHRSAPVKDASGVNSSINTPEQGDVTRSDATGELLSQARLQYRYGEYRYAVRTAERGLRIDRSKPEWYLILAESYLKLGSSSNAEQFARQGLRYSQSSGTYYERLKQISAGQY